MTTSKGFVALSSVPLGKPEISEIVQSWIDRFEGLEQVSPIGNATLSIATLDDVMWEDNLQFRVINGGEFSWIYIGMNSRVIETSGLPNDAISLCLDVILELPTVVEVVDENNEKRLNELEAQGLL